MSADASGSATQDERVVLEQAFAQGLAQMLEPLASQHSEAILAAQKSQLELNDSVEGLKAKLEEAVSYSALPMVGNYLHKLNDIKKRITSLTVVLGQANDRLVKAKATVETQYGPLKEKNDIDQKRINDYMKATGRVSPPLGGEPQERTRVAAASGATAAEGVAAPAAPAQAADAAADVADTAGPAASTVANEGETAATPEDEAEAATGAAAAPAAAEEGGDGDAEGGNSGDGATGSATAEPAAAAAVHVDPCDDVKGAQAAAGPQAAAEESAAEDGQKAADDGADAEA